MVVADTLFKKRDSRLVTYESGNSSTQIDYVLVRKANRKLIRDMKVVAGERCAPQHKLVVCDVNIKSMVERKRPFAPRRKIWKLKESAISDSFYIHFTQNLDKIDEVDRNGNVESKWAMSKDCLL